MILSIAFMFLCAFALAPFVTIALWMAFDGDRLREPAVAELVEAPEASEDRTAVPAVHSTESTPALVARGA